MPPGVRSPPAPGRCVLPARLRKLVFALGVKPLARSFIERLALSPSFRPISSRRFVSGRVNDGPSSGSSPPSNARGVAKSVPQVSNEGRSEGEGDASVGSNA
jgi:hypothetical protein